MNKHKKDCLIHLTTECWSFIGFNGGPLIVSPYTLSLSDLDDCRRSKYHLSINDIQIYIFNP